MKKYLLVILIAFGLVSLNLSAKDFKLPDNLSSIDEPVSVPSSKADCLVDEHRCDIEFMEIIVCAIDSFLCFSDGISTEFSWGLTAAMHWGILSEFQMPSADVIEENANSAKEKADFVDHEILEYLICRLDGDLCVDNSIYQHGSTNEQVVCEEIPDLCTRENDHR